MPVIMSDKRCYQLSVGWERRWRRRQRPGCLVLRRRAPAVEVPARRRDEHRRDDLPVRGAEVRLLPDADPGEERDLSQDHPELLAELQGLYQEWESELVAPLWEVPMNLSTRAKALKRRYGLEVAKPR